MLTEAPPTPRTIRVGPRDADLDDDVLKGRVLRVDHHVDEFSHVTEFSSGE